MLKGLPVDGYRPQSEHSVAVVNNNKQLEEILLRNLDELMGNPDYDKRWLAIARTHIEEGFMAMNRAVFRPQRIALAEDANA
jgi:hypothetical protein